MIWLSAASRTATFASIHSVRGSNCISELRTQDTSVDLTICSKSRPRFPLLHFRSCPWSLVELRMCVQTPACSTKILKQDSMVLQIGPFSCFRLLLYFGRNHICWYIAFEIVCMRWFQILCSLVYVPVLFVLATNIYRCVMYLWYSHRFLGACHRRVSRVFHVKYPSVAPFQVWVLHLKLVTTWTTA